MSAPHDCTCEKAVKIKEGGQVCQVCKGDAYDKLYVFAHTAEGQRLIALAHGQAPEPVPVSAEPPRAPVFDLADGDFVELDEIPEDHAEEPMKVISESGITIIEQSFLPLTPVAPVMPPTMIAPKPGRKKKEPKPKAPKQVAPVNQLLEAIKFIALAQRSKGEPMLTHCSIAYGGITAFDRTIAAGTLIREDDLLCFPETDKLLLALLRCGTDYKLVQLEKQLFVASTDFEAYVPLTTSDQLVTAVPDPMIAPLTDKFREALHTVGKLIKDNGATLLQSAVQLNNGTVIATNGQVIIEASHGSEFPPNKMLVPKRFVDALNKTKKKIIGFGFSPKTFTVHFECRSWLRTNLYEGAMEFDLVAALNKDAFYKKPVPESFFGAVEEVSKWSEDQKVYIFEAKISSHPKNKQNVGSARTFSLHGFVRNRAYSVLALKAISKFAKSMDDESVPKMTLFFDNNVRGAIMHDDVVEPVAPNPPMPDGWTYCGGCSERSYNTEYGACCNPNCQRYNVKQDCYLDDDIPF